VDDVVVDFSPLRRKDILDIAADCEAEAAKYDSFKGFDNNADVDKLGWEAPASMFEELVIWRIPVFSVVATFGERSDSRRFAEYVAKKYAEGQDVKYDKLKKEFADAEEDALESLDS
jgi:hypothetical protein